MLLVFAWVGDVALSLGLILGGALSLILRITDRKHGYR